MSGVSNIRPAGHNRPAGGFKMADLMNSEIQKNPQTFSLNMTIFRIHLYLILLTCLLTTNYDAIVHLLRLYQNVFDSPGIRG